MSNRFDRAQAWTGVAAVILWIVGLVVAIGVSDSISDKATDAETLAWIKGNANTVLLGSWIFMVGCLCFVWFAGVLRSRLTAAEGVPGTVSTIVFGGAIATAVFGILMRGGDVAAAISKNDITAANAGTLHRLSDVFFVGAELSAILVLGGVAVLGFRTGVVPRWWSIVSALVAVVLVIGPIGWAGLLFGIPVWTLVTSVMLTREPREVRSREAVPAAG
jgi:hypothetical protein